MMLFKKSIFILINALLLLKSLAEPNEKCPRVCSCIGVLLDCARRGLTHIPTNLPSMTEKLDLHSNEIVSIAEDSIYSLIKLRVLRMNSNKIIAIPENFLSMSFNLLRLDISYNKLDEILRNTFKGPKLLRSLHLDNNLIQCIHGSVFKELSELEILTLNNNSLSTIKEENLKGLAKLRTLRLSENPLHCNCDLIWFIKFLKRNLRLAPHARCQNPNSLVNKKINEISLDISNCAVQTKSFDTCKPRTTCSSPCKCNNGIVDCRKKSLTKIPNSFADSSIEIRMEQNFLTVVHSKAFSPYNVLRRIDLSNNNITVIAHDAFRGLNNLLTLVLYGNKIKELPVNLFKGLTSLQLLLLNANAITCIKRDTFKDLRNLSLLSLYDNNIKTIFDGTLEPLLNIRTLHLAKNPFMCDCNLKWLSEYLHKNPIETSGARCHTPKHLTRRRLESLRDEKIPCDRTASLAHQNCGVLFECPKDCFCYGSKIDCSQQNLTVISEEMPLITSDLLFEENLISVLHSDGFFGRLPNLQRLYLKNNLIKDIEPFAFEGAAKLEELYLDINKLSVIKNNMFSGLHSLKKLSLARNEITCMMPGSFDHFPQIFHVNLGENKFDCNCHVQWLAEWLKKRRILDPKAKCFQPEKLKGSSLLDLKPSSFVCFDGKDHGCLGNEYCPSNCTCKGTVIRCSKKNIFNIPLNIPAATTELYLDSNQISNVKAIHLPNLRDLIRLDLSSNKLYYLSDGMFIRLSSLSTLILNFNKIRCMHPNAFIGLKNLRVLSLHGNLLSTIPDGAFSDLFSLTHVAISANPFFCDCNLKWLSDWIKKDYVEPGIARCSDPLELMDKIILSTPSSNFICNGTPPLSVLSKCDHCFLNPCQNNAECSTIDGSYKCTCLPGYHGQDCEHLIDACYGNPCENNGICTVIDEGRFRCNCLEGFFGHRCEKNVDDCIQHKCLNGGTCVDGANEYTCICNENFTGKYCENLIFKCTEQTNPCQNNGKCIDQENGHYKCICQDGYTGDNCTVIVNPCSKNLCQNKATCVDEKNGYYCHCVNGFYGKFCESSIGVEMIYSQTSPCQNHECKHGECFQPDPTNSEYICKCFNGYTGKYCEYLTSISFNSNGSYVELETLQTKPFTNITITFSTSTSNGVLLYNGYEEHIAAELFHGRLRVSYDIGNYPVSSMYSFEMISDGRFHTVEMLAKDKNFTLRVDGGLSRSIINEGAKNHLKLSTNLFIGGFPKDVAAHAQKLWHIRNVSSFNGCLKEVWLNNKRVDFFNAINNERMKHGCHNFENNSSKSLFLEDKQIDCYNRSCVDPRCSNNSMKVNSKRLCEEVLIHSCKKEQLREFYVENECQSRQILKYAKCVGNCGNKCCNVKLEKKRKIRMICTDRSKYIKSLNIIRKCHCTSKCY